MRNDYLTAGSSTGPLHTPEGGCNLERLFVEHGDLRVSANAEATLNQLLEHVRERWTRDTYDLTGIVWATHGPKSFGGKPLDRVEPFGIDLVNDEMRSVVEAAARIGGAELLEQQLIKSVGAAAVAAMAPGAPPGMKPNEQGIKEALLKDTMLAFMSVSLMKMAAHDTDAIGATVFGASAFIDGEKRTVQPGLLCFHEHIATGPRRMWCPGTIPPDKNLPTLRGAFSTIEHWQSAPEVTRHPVMDGFLDILPPTAYGRSGGAA